jgi:hypothetical protein
MLAGITIVALVQVMAWGRFLDDVAERILVGRGDSDSIAKTANVQEGLRALAQACLQPVQSQRPTFAHILKQLDTLEQEFL